MADAFHEGGSFFRTVTMGKVWGVAELGGRWLREIAADERKIARSALPDLRIAGLHRALRKHGVRDR